MSLVIKKGKEEEDLKDQFLWSENEKALQRCTSHSVGKKTRAQRKEVSYSLLHSDTHVST